MAGGRMPGNALRVEPAATEARLGKKGSQSLGDWSRVVDFFDLDNLSRADTAGHYDGTPAGDNLKEIPGFRD